MDKLDQLNKKIQTYKQKRGRKTYKKAKFVFNSFNVALEIIAAVAIGLLIGFYLDQFFDLKFFFKITCLILAFVASLVNIYRAMNKH